MNQLPVLAVNELLRLLHSVYPLSPQLKQRIRREVQSCQVKNGDHLLKAGEICLNIYFVRRGWLRTYYITEKSGRQKEVSSWFNRPNEFCVSVHSFYDQVPGYEFIQAMEDCELLYVSFRQLENLYKEFMSFNFIGRALVTEVLKQSFRRNQFTAMLPAAERFIRLRESDPELVQRVPAKYLASYLDMDPSTLSRERRK